MIKAIFYKEWIKTRWYFLLTLVVTLGFSGYCMLNMNRIISLKGATHIWEVMISRDVVFVDLLQYIPLLTGILLGIVQFTPEMQRRCLKLTLHLPYPGLRMVGVMLLYGVMCLVIGFGSNFLLMSAYLHSVVAPELMNHILLCAAPWYIAGFTAYLCTTWICVEPTWKRRILNLIVSILVLRVFFLSTTPEAYNSFLPWLSLYTLLAASFTCLSVSRFKAGKQD